MRGNLAPWIAIAEDDEFQFIGETENLAKGGVCVVTDTPFPASSVLRCELGLAGSSIGVPTLMQVRWATKAADKPGYRLGLQFLF